VRQQLLLQMRCLLPRNQAWHCRCSTSWWRLLQLKRACLVRLHLALCRVQVQPQLLLLRRQQRQPLPWLLLQRWRLLPRRGH
jgi:hypothetical protein